jgi:hypothetical protein
MKLSGGWYDLKAKFDAKRSLRLNMRMRKKEDNGKGL